MYRTVLIAVMFAPLLASCAKEPRGEDDGGEIALRIVPHISTFVQPERSAADSRAIVEGTAFKSGHEVGYVILGSQYAFRNEGVPHVDGYGNVRAQATSNGDWLYYSYQSQYIGTSLPGLPSYGNVDIYGYHPYYAEFTEDDRFAIPFSLGTLSQDGDLLTTAAMVENDYMYATPHIGYVMRAGESARMSFHHVMTCLEFRISKAYAGPELRLKTIDFTIEGGSRVFRISGTYNATTGEVWCNPEDITTRILVDYDKSIPSASAGTTATIQCSLILPELEFKDENDDASITAVLHFADQDENSDGEKWEFHDGANSIYKFKLSDVVDPNTNRKGLCTGVHYLVRISVSNFVKYSGLPTVVVPDWDENKLDTDPNVI